MLISALYWLISDDSWYGEKLLLFTFSKYRDTLSLLILSLRILKIQQKCGRAELCVDQHEGTCSIIADTFAQQIFLAKTNIFKLRSADYLGDPAEYSPFHQTEIKDDIRCAENSVKTHILLSWMHKKVMYVLMKRHSHQTDIDCLWRCVYSVYLWTGLVGVWGGGLREHILYQIVFSSLNPI